ncbi:MAG: decaprenyl-phosphate phosphoribosyltransferase [Pirellula sp.]|nr:decaprenyl-phosphate phosphoribosyltransferase [Pirellula sp.]
MPLKDRASIRAARVANTLVAIAQAMRPQHWIKNLTCLAGLVFSGQLFSPLMQLRAASAFISFSAIASAVYLFNDIVDRRRDTLSKRTSQRPIASGRLPVPYAAAAAAMLTTAAAVASALIAPACLVVLLSYMFLNIAYSLRIKRTVIADVICIALGFIFRVLYGVYAVAVLPSSWIVLCVFFLALFLGFGKRRGEFDALASDAADARPVLKKYTTDFLNMAIGITASLTITTYSLYCVLSSHASSLVVTVLPVFYCVLRYAHQILFEGRGESPEKLLYADKMLWIGILTWCLLSVVAIYGNLDWLEFAGR